ncbi:hypothetical protein RKD25_007441 [Streptomyces sp. SAI-124]
MFGARLGLGVAEAASGEQLGEEELPLLVAALAADHLGVDEVALRDLGEARVGGGEQPEDLGDGGRADVRSPVFGGDGDGEQPGGGETLHLLARQPALGVPGGGTRAELLGERRGDREGLRVVGDHMGGHAPQPAAARTGRRPSAVENWSTTWARASVATGATLSAPSSCTVMSLSRVNQPCTMWAAPIELRTGLRA